MATEVETTSVSGQIKEDGPDVHLGHYESLRTRKYSRHFTHYFTNSNDATGYSEAVIGTGQDKIITNATFDDGWFMVPYWNPFVSMKPNEVLDLQLEASAVRVKGMGFTVKKKSIIREQVAVTGGVTGISAAFEAHPYYMIFRDKLHDLDCFVKPQKDIEPGPIYPTEWMFVNKFYTTSFPSSVEEGKLPRAYWNFQGSMEATQYTGQPLPRSLGSNKTNTMSIIDMFDVETKNEKDMISHSWTNGSEVWHPTAQQPMQIPWMNTSKTQYCGQMWPACRNDGITGIPSLPGSAVTPSVKYNSGMNYNMNSQVPTLQLDMPTDFYIKLNPVMTSDGPMELLSYITVEYWCEIEYRPTRLLLAPSFIADFTRKGDEAILMQTWNQYHPKHMHTYQADFPMATATDIESFIYSKTAGNAKYTWFSWQLITDVRDSTKYFDQFMFPDGYVITAMVFEKVSWRNDTGTADWDVLQTFNDGNQGTGIKVMTLDTNTGQEHLWQIASQSNMYREVTLFVQNVAHQYTYITAGTHQPTYSGRFSDTSDYTNEKDMVAQCLDDTTVNDITGKLRFDNKVPIYWKGTIIEQVDNPAVLTGQELIEDFKRKNGRDVLRPSLGPPRSQTVSRMPAAGGHGQQGAAYLLPRKRKETLRSVDGGRDPKELRGEQLGDKEGGAGHSREGL